MNGILIGVNRKSVGYSLAKIQLLDKMLVIIGELCYALSIHYDRMVVDSQICFSRQLFPSTCQTEKTMTLLGGSLIRWYGCVTVPRHL